LRTLIIIGTSIALALAAAGAARAGCAATVGLSPQPPTEAGAAWNTRITVLQHGVRPLEGAHPTLTIRNVDSGASKTFAAKPTGKTGVYAAEVVFPSRGSWRYEVNDGFPVQECAQTHTFAPIDISGGGSSSSSPAWTIGGTSVLALMFGLLLLAGLRVSRRPVLAATPR
jgi:hypothetical protein